MCVPDKVYYDKKRQKKSNAIRQKISEKNCAGNAQRDDVEWRSVFGLVFQDQIRRHFEQPRKQKRLQHDK